MAPDAQDPNNNRTSDAATEITVVVVDDDPDVRTTLCRILLEEKFIVLEAQTGNEAELRVLASEVDVVLSDVRMPDMNGMELLERLKKTDECVSVLLISGAPDLETALRAVELGASGYLKKPIENADLIQAVARAAAVSRKKRTDSLTLESLRTGVQRWNSTAPLSGSWTGTLLGGRYKIGEQIGAGGMGVVYEAERTDLANMVVAIKILHTELHKNEGILARFRREAETVARLNHQNIVRVLDYGADEDGPAFIVMERLRGRSLAELIVAQGSLGIGRTAFIAVQTLFALEQAHTNGIVHRDLKPENIFLTAVSGVKDIVRVLDFGVAKVSNADQHLRLTRTGAVMGTPLYLAPEQARGEEADERSDLYSIGCIIYESLSGEPPIQAESYNSLLLNIQNEAPVPICNLRPDLAPEFGAVVARALEKNPSDRFQSAREMLDALQPWLPAIEPRVQMSVPPSTKVLGKRDLAHHLKTTRREGNR